MRRPLLFLVALAPALSLVAPTAAAESDRTLGRRDAIVAAAPPDATGVALAPTQGCRAMLRAGEGDCGVVSAGDQPMLFTIEPGPPIDDVLVSRPWLVRVYRPDPAAADAWIPVFATPAEGDLAGPLFAAVTAAVGDVTGDGRDDLVVGYRSEGTGQFLDVDVIATGADGVPTVLGHDRLDKGTVLVRPGRLVEYSPEYRRKDANCCPTWVRRSVVRFVDGRLVVHEGARRPVEDVEIPAGDIG